MCVIAVCKEVMPSAQELKDMETANPQGGGVAWQQAGQVLYAKGMKAEQMIQWIEDKTIKLPAIFHFRINTVGGTTSQLCHPFPISPMVPLKISGAAKGVLFHNGHWSNWEKAVKDTILMMRRGFVPPGPWSDSRAMAWMVALHGIHALQFLVDAQQKIAIMTPDKIIRMGKFEEHRGYFVSNKSWQYKTMVMEYSKGTYLGRDYCFGGADDDLPVYKKYNTGRICYERNCHELAIPDDYFCDKHMPPARKAAMNAIKAEREKKLLEAAGKETKVEAQGA